MLRLVPMDEAAFRAFLDRAIPRRAERYVRRGLWKEDRALETSREEYARHFPLGPATPHQNLVDVVEEPSGARVGEVWYEAREAGGKVDFCIEWLFIEPEYRRRGYATEVLRLLEDEARRRGAEWTRLMVWMDNPGARQLYVRLGYETQVMGMAKPLPRGPPTAPEHATDRGATRRPSS